MASFRNKQKKKTHKEEEFVQLSVSLVINKRSTLIQTTFITFDEWEITVVCKQLMAASATSLLPFK